MPENGKNGISPYTELTPREYSGLLEAININWIDDVRRKIEPYPGPLLHASFALAGSDGKLERHAQSPTELVIFQDPGQGPYFDREFGRWYENTYEKPIREDFDVDPLTKLPEVKRLGNPRPLSYTYGQPDTIYPDRILNTHYVIGNEDIYARARRQVLEEMIADDPIARRIREHMGNQFRQYRRALESGQYRRNQIFTVDPPMQYYNEVQGDLRVGFKISALRLVQRGLDLATVKAIRNGKLTIEEAMKLPTNTTERLKFFRERGILQMGETIDDAYTWFLQQYHRAQEEYKNTRQMVELPFDVSKFLQNKKILMEFVDQVKRLNGLNGIVT